MTIIFYDKTTYSQNFDLMFTCFHTKNYSNFPKLLVVYSEIKDIYFKFCFYKKIYFS